MGSTDRAAPPAAARLRGLYHRWVPPPIRLPLGRARRNLLDLAIRLAGRQGPLPPRRWLKAVQLTPWVMEYLEVGRRCADTIRRQLDGIEPNGAAPRRLLDFGCGLGRSLRHLRGLGWELHGCDVDRRSVAWCGRALPVARVVLSPPDPPLPYPEATFDAVYAISVFSHFPPARQRAWPGELARVLRPGGLAIVSTMGPWAFDPFPEGARADPAIPGFWFCAAGTAFNDSAAVHTEEAIASLFHSGFESVRWTRGGLDGFQDLTVATRRRD